MIYELRIYETVPGKLPDLHRRFDTITLKIWEAEPAAGAGLPGTVIGAIEGRPVIACGRDALVLTTLQRTGGRKVSSAEFTRGQPMPAGTRFES